jgi:hypothetical protein
LKGTKIGNIHDRKTLWCNPVPILKVENYVTEIERDRSYLEKIINTGVA